MNKRKLPQYFGSITPRKAVEGIEAAISNAKDLLKEAELLLENDCYPRAFALAVLAIEEEGKVLIIKEILCANDGRELEKAWDSYRTHTDKTLAWPAIDLLKNGATKLKDFLPVFLRDSSHRKLFDGMKQQALYSDVHDQCNWSKPADVIDKQMAGNKIAEAKIMLGLIDIESEASLALLMKHTKLPESTALSDRMLAHLNFLKEAEEKGLIKKGKYEAMKQFILSGLPSKI